MIDPVTAYAWSAAALSTGIAAGALFRLAHWNGVACRYAQLAAERQAKIDDQDATIARLERLRDGLARDIVEAETKIAQWVPKRGPKGHFLKPSIEPTT